MADDFKYSAYFGALHDKYARLDLQQEQLVDLVADKYSDQKDRRIIGRVIQAEIREDGFVRAFIRIPEVHDYCVPEACEYPGKKGLMLKFNQIFAISKYKVDTINSNPVGTSGNPVAGTAEKPASASEFVGKDVYVEFVDGGPNERGKLRKARFELKTFQENFGKDVKSCYSSGGDEVNWDSIGFAFGNVLGPEQPAISLSKQPKGDKQNYTLETIDQTYFYNMTGQAIMATSDNNSIVESGPPGKLTNKKPTSDLAKGWLAAVTKLVNFHLIVTSATRGPLGQAKAEYNKLAAGDVSVYADSYEKYLNKVYKDCGKDKACTINTLEAYHKSKNPKGHGAGVSVDLRTTSWLTQPQVKYLMKVCKLLKSPTVYLEPNPPHLHVTIARYNRLKTNTGDGNLDPKKVANKIKEWNSIVEKELRNPTILKNIPGARYIPGKP